MCGVKGERHFASTVVTTENNEYSVTMYKFGKLGKL